MSFLNKNKSSNKFKVLIFLFPFLFVYILGIGGLSETGIKVFAQERSSSDITSDPGSSGASSDIRTEPVNSITTLRNPLKVNSLGDALNLFLQVLTYLAIFAGVLAIIWTGFQLVAAQGNPTKMKDAGKRLGNIMIGVALVLGARLIISIILNTLKATGTLDPRVIDSAGQVINPPSR